MKFKRTQTTKQNKKKMHDENEKFNKENGIHTKDPNRNPRAEE